MPIGRESKRSQELIINTDTLSLIPFDSIAPHPIPLPCLRRSGFAQADSGERGGGSLVKKLNASVLIYRGFVKA
jgi:hypothetical protein